MTRRCHALRFIILYVFTAKSLSRCPFSLKNSIFLWFIHPHFERNLFPAESSLTLNLWNKAILLLLLLLMEHIYRPPSHEMSFSLLLSIIVTDFVISYKLNDETNIFVSWFPRTHRLIYPWSSLDSVWGSTSIQHKHLNNVHLAGDYPRIKKGKTVQQSRNNYFRFGHYCESVLFW